MAAVETKIGKQQVEIMLVETVGKEIIGMLNNNSISVTATYDRLQHGVSRISINIPEDGLNDSDLNEIVSVGVINLLIQKMNNSSDVSMTKSILREIIRETWGRPFIFITKNG